MLEVRKEQPVNATSIHLQWSEPGLDRRFCTGVSLHSHTLHSLESLDFIYQAARYSTLLRWALRKAEARYYEQNGEPLDWDLAVLLEALHANADTLIVLNHPFWDEQGVGTPIHNGALLDFLSAYCPWIHAIEINGLRPWEENRSAMRLAEDWSKPSVA